MELHRHSRGDSLPYKLPLPSQRPCIIPTERGILGAGHQGMDFTAEDRVDFAAYNRILWKGMMGNKPYPAAPTGLDLRQNRDELLARYRRSLAQEAKLKSIRH